LEQKKRLLADQRIRKQTAFKNLVAQGIFARGVFFYLWMGRQENLGQKAAKKRPMLGVVVGRTVHASAVRRNILKRRIREIFRDKQGFLKEDAALLIKMRQVPKQPAFAEMEAELVKLLKQVGAWA